MIVREIKSNVLDFAYDPHSVIWLVKEWNNKTTIFRADKPTDVLFKGSVTLWSSSYDNLDICDGFASVYGTTFDLSNPARKVQTDEITVRSGHPIKLGQFPSMLQRNVLLAGRCVGTHHVRWAQNDPSFLYLDQGTVKIWDVLHNSQRPTILTPVGHMSPLPTGSFLRLDNDRWAMYGNHSTIVLRTRLSVLDGNQLYSWWLPSTRSRSDRLFNNYAQDILWSASHNRVSVMTSNDNHMKFFVFDPRDCEPDQEISKYEMFDVKFPRNRNLRPWRLKFSPDSLTLTGMFRSPGRRESLVTIDVD